MRYRAECQCGQLNIETDSEPYATVVCHCNACKKRTGSVLGAGAYFERDAVAVFGESNCFQRTIEERWFRSYFCPDCGTSVYWIADLHPASIGVALGCFDEKTSFAPDRSVWETKKLPWLHFDKSLPGHIEGSRSTKTR